MKIQEFNIKVKALQEITHAEKTKLVKAFAIANNKVKIGNTVTDHAGSIIVEKIGIYHDIVPGCTYIGLMLTTKGIPFKTRQVRTIYQINMKSLNGEPA